MKTKNKNLIAFILFITIAIPVQAKFRDIDRNKYKLEEHKLPRPNSSLNPAKVNRQSKPKLIPVIKCIPQKPKQINDLDTLKNIL